MSRQTAIAVRAARRPVATSAALRTPTDRRAAIFDAAALVFAIKGFYGASTQDIADVLGIKQASLYYYFASKEAALETVCLIGAEGFHDRAKAIVDMDCGAVEKLRALVKSHTLPLVERADYVRVFLNQRQFLPSASRRKIGRWSRGIERLFERVISDGIADGAFRRGLDARLATLTILGALNGVPAWFDKEGRDVDAIVDATTDLILGGLIRR